jgi:hypothetical protein
LGVGGHGDSSDWYYLCAVSACSHPIGIRIGITYVACIQVSAAATVGRRLGVGGHGDSSDWYYLCAVSACSHPIGIRIGITYVACIQVSAATTTGRSLGLMGLGIQVTLVLVFGIGISFVR